MRARIVALLLAALAALLMVCGAAGGGCSDSKSDDFTRKCNAKGGVVHTTHRDGSTSRVCKPAPVPKPQPGWQ